MQASEAALVAYTEYMATWEDRLPDGDLSGRALELAWSRLRRRCAKVHTNPTGESRFPWRDLDFFWPKQHDTMYP